ncbi:MAG: phosphoadenylyl-sulfate reductase [Nitrospirae bacterium]|nr:phosphoadenylyl-sulfate reductase [Nitrospirota bacterium]
MIGTNRDVGNARELLLEGFPRIQDSLDDEPAENILRWAFETFDNKVAIASSFGAEDVVLIDISARIKPNVRIFTLDTGRLPHETYQLIDEIKEKYNVAIEVCFPDEQRIRTMVQEHGFNLFYKGVAERRLCCNIRKVEPLQKKLGELGAWVCGLRREQAVTRTGIKTVEIDTSNHGIIKINPLAAWTEKDIWNYIKENEVPYNSLHDKGYPSIGCAPCTRSVRAIEDVRAGRWWWESPELKECGLHKKDQN